MSGKNSWQLTTPIDAIVFDCDGTLTRIEGIDELAAMNGCGPEIATLTAAAMTQGSLTSALYDQRLARVKPSLQQVQTLAQHYFAQRTPELIDTLKILQKLGKTIYVVSAGVNPAVSQFAEQLGIDRAHVFAVDLYFDAMGAYQDFDRSAVLTNNSGKRQIVAQLQQRHPHILHIGDGMNDFVTHDFVTRFVGYGGIYYRQNLADLCEFYLADASLAALLPLTLTAAEVAQLNSAETDLYQLGLGKL